MAEPQPHKAVTTLRELRALSPADAAERWPEVSALIVAMTKGWRPREGGAPKSFADVRQMSKSEILEHWPAVVAILEGATGGDAAGPEPKTIEDVAKMTADQVAAHIDVVRGIVGKDGGAK